MLKTPVNGKIWIQGEQNISFIDRLSRTFIFQLSRSGKWLRTEQITT